MKHVVSASRRTDMPSCYLDILIDFLRQGRAEVPNPYSGRIATVDLLPENVHTIVLWSKNYGPFLACDHVFDPYRLYFLFTINDMPGLEPGVPPLEERLAQAEELARRYGPERIGWRYDPVVFRTEGPVSTISSYETIGARLARMGVTRSIFSFLDLYGKVRTRNRSLGLGIVDPPLQVKLDYASRLAETAASLGMSLQSCCESIDVMDGITPSSCIDGKLLSRLAGEAAPAERDNGQRKNCGCTISRDIGSYRDMPCANGCRYCYANPII